MDASQHQHTSPRPVSQMPNPASRGAAPIAPCTLEFVRLWRKQLQPATGNAGMTAFFVDGVGVVGRGMPDWRTTREVLRGERDYEPDRILEPDAAMLPPNERRRAAVSVRWALAAAGQAGSAGSYDATEVATVFATSGSDGETLHRICEALASPERELSPTRFHNSVHNAAAGYWTIAPGSPPPAPPAGRRRPPASVCGYDASFAAGLLEAVSQVYAEQTAVLLVAYDVPYPPP